MSYLGAQNAIKGFVFLYYMDVNSMYNKRLLWCDTLNLVVTT